MVLTRRRVGRGGRLHVVVIFGLIFLVALVAQTFLLFHHISMYNSGGLFPDTSNCSQSTSGSNQDYALASYESFGFFQDVSTAEWRLKQNIAIQTRHHLAPEDDKVSSFFYRPRGWYQNNWEPDFSCSFERFLGPIRDGHKWVCDPHRLAQKKDCLVYSFGCNGNVDFEKAVLEVAPHCEIHIFDPGFYEMEVETSLPNAHYHQYGVKPSYETDPSLHLNKDLPEGEFKTFQEIVRELQHNKRTVDIFKMDIEGGEWTTFRDWVKGPGNMFSWMGTDILLQQILIEVHDAPIIANTFFAELHKAGYAMFHKEPNIQFAGGDCVEFGFIKLRPSFFEGDTMPVDHSPQALTHAKEHHDEYARNQANPDFDYSREMRLTGVVRSYDVGYDQNDTGIFGHDDLVNENGFDDIEFKDDDGGVPK